MHQPYQDDDVLVFGIHQSQPPDQLEDFREQTGVTFPFVADENYSVGSLSVPPGVGSFYPYPRDVIVGKDLTIRMIRHSFNPDEVEALVEELIAE